ncbi:MAG: chromosome segregation protein SMC, partial [Thermodesulfobacteriota bacterium]
ESQKSIINEKERLSAEAGRKLEARKSETADGKDEKTEAARKIEEIKKTLADLLAGKDGIKIVEVEKQEELTVFSNNIDGLGGRLKEERHALQDLQEKKGDGTIQVREMEMALENLLEKIIERYGLQIETYSPTEEDSEQLNTLDGDISERAGFLKDKITSLGEVSLAALEEYNELEVRYNFLLTQQADLTESVEGLLKAITKINRTSRERFKKTFDEINEKFKETFPKFFSGGRAELRLEDETNVLESGIEIVAQPPGKKLQNIMLLSGGEKALTATAFIFSIFLIKPSPFCLLDEVDAPLDDANIERFNGFVHEMSQRSQFILITHNKRTMEVADTLYGITMEEPGVSKCVTVEL